MNLLPSINKKNFLLLAIFSVFTLNMAAQKSEPDFWRHVRFGGGLGLNFVDNFFSATIAPSAINEFDRNFTLGLGFNATFFNQKNVHKTTVLGGSLVGLYNVISELQLSGEFEQLNVNRK